MEYATITSLHADRVAPPNRSVSGYGNKIPTRFRVTVQDSGSDRLRRVYAICYSNAASFYVIVNGERVFVRDVDLEDRVPFYTYRGQ